MEKAEGMAAQEFQSGRKLLGRLPHGRDLVVAVEDFCAEGHIATAVFTIIGAVTSVTLGAYDQNQQVYVTFEKQGHFEIVHCTGNVSVRDEKPTIHAHGVFADMDGKTFGGHVFSKTMVYAAEIYLFELQGTPLVRKYDEQTGLYLWQ
jgi:predicted DNA-binding protein with PD1-like motif